jgi:hypothetical protein
VPASSTETVRHFLPSQYRNLHRPEARKDKCKSFAWKIKKDHELEMIFLYVFNSVLSVK